MHINSLIQLCCENAATTDGAVSGAVSGNRVLSKALRALKRSHSDEEDSTEKRRAEALLEVPRGIFMDIFSSSSGNAGMTSVDESPQGGLLLDTESIVLPPPPTVGLEMVCFTAYHSVLTQWNSVLPLPVFVCTFIYLLTRTCTLQSAVCKI